MNPSVSYIKASDGSGDASLMTITQVRTAPATSITVNTVAGVPNKFFATMGTPHTFNDPVTGETITIISEATAVNFAGHVNSGKIEIDAIADGETDLGSKVGDIIIIRPTTQWADNLHDVLAKSLSDDGSIKPEAVVYNPNIYNYIQSGGVVSSVSGLNGAISAIVGWIDGYRGTVSAVASRAFTATKDTYIDVLRNTTTNAFSLVYTEVANNAASPILAVNSIRLAKVVTNGSTITGVFQEGVNDSLGNMIRPLTIGSKYTDANGWTVFEYGTHRKYTRNVSISTGSVVPQGIASTSNFAPPVGMTSLTNAFVQVSLRATGFDANRFSSVLQQRSLPTNLFIEVFNAWSGGSLSLAGTFTVEITV